MGCAVVVPGKLLRPEEARPTGPVVFGGVVNDPVFPAVG
jgi:hypothetical protein